MTEQQRVLVTGISGFVGTTLCDAFAGDDKWKLIGLDRVPPRERWPDVAYGICDILDRADLVRRVAEVEPDFIVHLAARARVQDGVQDPVGTYRTNVEGTLNVLEAAARAPTLQRMIYVSSETVYGKVERYPTPEDLGPGRPLSAYAASKAASDLLCQQFGKIPVVVARSAMGCGPRSSPEEQVTSRFVQNVLRDRPLLFPGTEEGQPVAVEHPTRDVSPAWNFVDGIRLLLLADHAEGVYNLGSGREISMLDLAKTVQRVLGAGKIKYDPAFRYRSGETGYRTALDITRARKELGYEPKVSLEDAIGLTARWMGLQGQHYWHRARVPWHHAWRP